MRNIEQQLIQEVRRRTLLATLASVVALCATFGYLLLTQYSQRKQSIEQDAVVYTFLALQQKDRVKMESALDRVVSTGGGATSALLCEGSRIIYSYPKKMGACKGGLNSGWNKAVVFQKADFGEYSLWVVHPYISFSETLFAGLFILVLLILLPLVILKGLTSELVACLLYTSPSPRDRQKSRMPSSA